MIDQKKWTTHVDRTFPKEMGKNDKRLLFHMGIVGEWGEVVDRVKKIMFHASKPSPTSKLDASNFLEIPGYGDKEILAEAGDVLWYTTAFAQFIDDSYFWPLENFYCHWITMLEREAGVLSPSKHKQIVGRLFLAVEVELRKISGMLDLKINTPELVKALGKISLLVLRLALRYGHTTSSVLAHNVAKLEARYPHGFDPERSQNRDAT